MAKMVPAIRFKGFEGEWDVKPFSDLVVRVNTPDNGSDLPRVEYEDINSGMGTLKPDVYCKDNRNKKGIKFRKSDILYGKLRPYLKNYYFSKIDGVAVGDFWVYRAKKTDPKFIYSLIQTDRYTKIANLSSGSKMPRSEWNLVSNCRFLYPDFQEQEKIGALFQSIDQVISLQTARLQDRKTFKQAMLQKMFPKEGAKVPEIRFRGFEGEWEEKNLSEIVDVIGGGTPSSSNKSYWDGGINWYTPSEIEDTRYVNRSMRTITDKGLNNCSARLLPKGRTILFTSRATIGSMAILAEDATTNQGFQSFVIKDLEETDVYFLFCQNRSFERYAKKKSHGSTFKEVSGSEMRKMPLPIPKIAEQVKIGHFFKTLDETIEAEEARLISYQTLKASLLQKMFI